MAKLKNKTLQIKGARLHNLKSVDVTIKHGDFVVVTGLSGSGKSSLIFDTLYAEGRRRYVESLSSYARQFLGKIEKPPVEYIKGIAPAIAIEQKKASNTPRSTVGTSTEIYDYLKLLFAHIGKTHHPETNRIAHQHCAEDVLNFLKKITENSKILLLAPLYFSEGTSVKSILESYLQRGYARIFIAGQTHRLDDANWKEKYTDKKLVFLAKKNNVFLVTDRLVIKKNTDFEALVPSINNAFISGSGRLSVQNLTAEKRIDFSNLLEIDGMVFDKPTPHLFSFNNPLGACEKCEGYGDIMGIAPELVIPNENLSIYEGAIAPWRSESNKKYYEKLIMAAAANEIPLHTPWFKIEKSKREIIWRGKNFKGINDFFKYVESKSYKIQARILLSRFRGRTACKHCEGSRLKKEALFVKINGQNIAVLTKMPLTKLADFFENLPLTKEENAISKRVLYEIKKRVNLLKNVGLGYLTLDRKSGTLSGGETQRIQLATSLATNLVGALYILDEPSVGLHPKDTENLIAVLKKLQALGNTVIVVEHDEQMMRAADSIIDMGPAAGSKGGQLIAQGDFKSLLKTDSITAKYLTGKLSVERKTPTKKSKHYINIKGARAHNLKNIDVKIPLHKMVAITGVSGSGKSSLIRDVLYPSVKAHLENVTVKAPVKNIEGAIDTVEKIIFIDQNPLGRSSRSNIVTYIKAYDDIRALFASQTDAKMNHLTAKHFSFNVDAGRCEECKGDGFTTVSMQFMADVTLTCENCKGKRFQKQVLSVQFAGKNIYDILSYSVDDAVDFFIAQGAEKIAARLYPLQAVGLGYVNLGQSTATFSTGEAQRLKLASFLVRGASKEKTLFLFDEPTTGLHFDDVQKLIGAFEALLQKGHSIVIIEHHTDLIKCADYVIELGKEGGEKGGELIFEGTPEAMKKSNKSITGRFL